MQNIQAAQDFLLPHKKKHELNLANQQTTYSSLLFDVMPFSFLIKILNKFL